MKRIFVVSVVALVLAMTGIAWGAGTADAPKNEQHRPTPVTCTIQGLRPFSETVWDKSKWERGMPASNVLAAYQRRLSCAPVAHKKAMKNKWSSDKRVYFKYRAKELYRERYTPFYGCTSLGGCKYWAIPAYIVNCESGGDYTPDLGLTFGGAYGILVSTWHQWGGGKYASQANYAEPKHQDRIAHELWTDLGPSPWACA